MHLSWSEAYGFSDVMRVNGIGDVMLVCKIEKVSRDILVEKSRKDTVISEKLVSKIGAKACPQKRRPNQLSGRVGFPCWHVKPFANGPWKSLVIR